MGLDLEGSAWWIKKERHTEGGGGGSEGGEEGREEGGESERDRELLQQAKLKSELNTGRKRPQPLIA